MQVRVIKVMEGFTPIPLEGAVLKNKIDPISKLDWGEQAIVIESIPVLFELLHIPDPAYIVNIINISFNALLASEEAEIVILNLGQISQLRLILTYMEEAESPSRRIEISMIRADDVTDIFTFSEIQENKMFNYRRQTIFTWD